MLDEITWHNSSKLTTYTYVCEKPKLVFLHHFSLINGHIDHDFHLHKKSKVNDMEDANLHDIYGKF